MDALSDVLSMMRVGSVLSSRFEGRGAWSFRFPAYRHIKFGGVLSGRFYLWVDGGSPVALEKGDFFALTDGRPFYSATDLSRTPVDGEREFSHEAGGAGVHRFQGEGTEGGVCLSSGRFTFDDDSAQILLRQLPPLIHLPANEFDAGPLSRLLELMRWETSAMHPGAEVARSSLAALALVHVLRLYLSSTREPTGWLGALADPKIGRALSLMHERPGARWTVDDLAQTVGMSRTAFANRFRDLVGDTPLEYLNGWRMALARAALRNTSEPLARIAERVGYLSDTAFSSAFKRSTGLSPGRFRAAAPPSQSLSQ